MPHAVDMMHLKEEMKVKTVVVALNSQYVHTALAARSLCRAVEREGSLPRQEIELWEGTINEDWRRSAVRLYQLQADVYAFSLYIWNVDTAEAIAERLKQVLPQCRIVVGGPEVIAAGSERFSSWTWCDDILVGEAEQTFPQYLRCVETGTSPQGIEGYFGRSAGLVQASEHSVPPVVCDLAELPFPYTDAELYSASPRIFYYESSRGCPFRCAYCLSALQKPVRFRPLALVFQDLLRFMEAGVPQVKFVDRTFNCQAEHCLGIWEYLIEAAPKYSTSFHFELEASLLDERMLQVLSKAPEGLFQFEIGVQSTHIPTLEAVARPNHLPEIAVQVRKLLSLRKQHVHLDLIAGLPEEGMEQILTSFNWAAALRPDMLQMGFLKVLPGSILQATASERQDVYSARPPYEILATKWLNHDELLHVQHIADLVDRYGNPGRFRLILEGLERLAGSPFMMYSHMAYFWQQQDYGQSSREHTHYERFVAFASHLGMEEVEIVCRLACDFCMWHRSEELPRILSMAVANDSALFQKLRQQTNRETVIALFPELEPYSQKFLWQQIRFEHFCHNPDTLTQGIPHHSDANQVQLFVRSKNHYGNAKARRRAVRVE